MASSRSLLRELRGPFVPPSANFTQAVPSHVPALPLAVQLRSQHLMPSTQTLAPLACDSPVKNVATRDAYGSALLDLGAKREDIIVLDADLSGSTKTKAFAKAYPTRFFNQGVAEANMMGTAAGLAAMGYTVFASSFAMFAAGKPWEQIRQSICVPELSVKICATHAGLTVGEDGKSHQMLEDITLMRVLPFMRVIVPADAVEAAAAVRTAAETDGPFYIRLSRASTPVIFSDDYQFKIGKGAILREGSDICIAACGVCVAPALQAAEQLSELGIQARVINLATIDPIDADLILDSAEHCGAILTVEEHQIRGGLGDAVAQAVVHGKPVPMAMLGMNNSFGQSGTAEQLLAHYGLDAPAIVARSQELLQRKA
ncbi:MAG: transketolase [Glaciecola sp.]|jgi:transketolase